MTEVKTRAPRKPATEFGQSFRGFVGSVNPAKLAIIVGQAINESDSEKVQSSISSVVRKAGQSSGVVSVRSKPLIEAILAGVVKLDDTLTAKADKLRKDFQYEAISNTGREPGTNWLVKLKSGEAVPLKDGPNGDAYYKLEYVRDLDTEGTAEADSDDAPVAEEE